MVDNDMERFAVAMLLMYKAFNKPVDRDITKLNFLTLKHLTIDDAEQCISLAIMHEERFPSPFALKRYVSMIPPRPVAKIAYEPFGQRSEKLATDAGRLINGYLAGKLNRDGLLEGMKAMNHDYPGMGWDREAAGLVCHFRETEEVKGESGLRFGA